MLLKLGMCCRPVHERERRRNCQADGHQGACAWWGEFRRGHERVRARQHRWCALFEASTTAESIAFLACPLRACIMVCGALKQQLFSHSCMTTKGGATGSWPEEDNF